MTRQLVDVLDERGLLLDDADHLVASLLTDGPAEHTIVCPRCRGKGYLPFVGARISGGHDPLVRCRDCGGTGHGQTVTVVALTAADLAAIQDQTGLLR